MRQFYFRYFITKIFALVKAFTYQRSVSKLSNLVYIILTQTKQYFQYGSGTDS